MRLIKQNIIANFGGKAWQALMSLAFIPLYIKFMGIESYGLIGIFASLLSVFSMLDMGLSTTLNRELARLSIVPDKAQEMRNLVRTLELPYWGFAFFIGITVVCLSGPIAEYWVKADKLTPATVKQALIIMGVIMALRWPVSLYSGGLMGLQKQKLLNVINGFEATIRGLGAVLVLWLISPTIQAFFIWQIFISMVNIALTAGFLWHSLPKSSQHSQFQKQLLFRIRSFAAGITGISITTVIITQIDKIVLSKILPLEMFGYYVLASVVANTLYFFISPVFTALFPRFSQLVSIDDQAGLVKLYHNSCQFMSVMILPAAIVVSFFSSEILFLWTGDSVTVANIHSIVSILIIGIACSGLMNLPYGLQLAHAWTKLTLYTGIIASILLVPMIYFFVTYYGIAGAAIAFVIMSIGEVFICIPIMHRRLLQGEKWRWYCEDIGLPFVVALGVAGAFRLTVPVPDQQLFQVVYLALVSGLTLGVTALATPVTRNWFLGLKLLN
jgi:O-antigen/teichoic acid export membrane protein